ncbi:hypothetical protein INR49_013613 [Caranx melampygus]|nr:hypothetical protein INR49_013613 [Caranx melampygus]
MAALKGWVVGLLLVLLCPSQVPLSGVVSGQDVAEAEADLHARNDDVVAEEGETTVSLKLTTQQKTRRTQVKTSTALTTVTSAPVKREMSQTIVSTAKAAHPATFAPYCVTQYALQNRCLSPLSILETLSFGGHCGHILHCAQDQGLSDCSGCHQSEITKSSVCINA